jgi:hypothetical protein
MADQLTEAQAVAFGNGKLWEPLTYRQRAEFQLTQGLLCMPFAVFHEAVEKALGRPVWTHEFGTLGRDRLIRELLGDRPAPTLREVMEMIPVGKRVVVVVPDAEGS